MSGTKKEKAPRKSKPAAASAQTLADSAVGNGQALEPATTLPGHYVAVGSVPVLAPQAAIQSVIEERVSPDYQMPKIEGWSVPADAVALAREIPVPQTDDVEALEVRARSERGFWRCGRFWPSQPVNVFATDDPEGDNAAGVDSCALAVNCFISHEDAARLKSEPQLIVTVLETVSAPLESD